MINQLHAKDNFPKGSVLTFGNFDGVHAGHQALLIQLQQIEAAEQLPAAVVSFEPLAKEFFNPQSAPARLTTAFEKKLLLQQLGFTHIYFLRFNHALAQLSAYDFLSTLCKTLNVKHFVVGSDVRFGNQRQGDIDFLKQHASQFNYKVNIIEKVKINNEIVSSSYIRTILADGDFKKAKQLLNRNFTMTSRIIYGAARGRTINFPTINLPIKRIQSPLHGVYAVQVLINKKRYGGVANIGNRPTVDGKNWLLEVHLFDSEENLYGLRAEVFFIEKIRAEQKFADFSALKTQIAEDVQKAKLIDQTVTLHPLTGIFSRSGA